MAIKKKQGRKKKEKVKEEKVEQISTLNTSDGFIPTPENKNGETVGTVLAQIKESSKIEFSFDGLISGSNIERLKARIKREYRGWKTSFIEKKIFVKKEK